MPKRSALDPAARVIRICGGINAVVGITGKSRGRVRRWTQPKSKEGTGGRVPPDSIDLILAWAKAHDKPITAEMFFPSVARVRPVRRVRAVALGAT